VGSPDTWSVIWVVAAGFFVLVEMLRRLRLWFLPFAVGAATAAVSAWAGLAVAAQWVVFVGVSAAALAALRPLGRRLNQHGPAAPVGSGRWIGQEAFVEVDIPARGGSGWVRLGRERWRAESGLAIPIPASSTVLVTAVNGTQLTVLPLDYPEITQAPPGPGPGDESWPVPGPGQGA
jgi:membrane protein implicated in regulation of membrane protease activity